MGCSQEKWGTWCDGSQDNIDDWLQKEFKWKWDRYESNRQLEVEEGKKIFDKILKNKQLFYKGYNIVKKNFLTVYDEDYAKGARYVYSDGKTSKSRDMTPIEFMWHVNGGLMSPYCSEGSKYREFPKVPSFVTEKNMEIPKYVEAKSNSSKVHDKFIGSFAGSFGTKNRKTRWI